jgi:DNA repair exonuclease SbcCD ATPase subunit
MRILRASANNFASYKEVALDFTQKRLSLVSGPTGAGKSTLCDLIPWILFGKTAKGGAVDDIIPWNPIDTTAGSLMIDTITVTRTRSPNDLFFYKNGVINRGKDNTDTQKLINQELGFDYDTYLAGAYFHEFSHTASFFVSTAKIRRQIIEELVDLSLAVRLSEAAKVNKKTIKADIDEMSIELVTKRRVVESLTNQVKQNEHWSNTWESKKIKDLEVLQQDHVHFERDKATDTEDTQVAHIKQSISLEHDIDDFELELEDIKVELLATPDISTEIATIKDTKCDHCGSKLESTRILLLTKQQNKRESLLQRRTLVESRLTTKLEALTLAQKRLNDRLHDIETRIDHSQNDIKKLQAITNPYHDQLNALRTEIELSNGIIELSQLQLDELRVELSDTELLLSLIDDLRKACVKTTVVDIQMRTNNYLSQYFDGEIKVKFDLEDSDKINVEIFKDGNSCSYTQLSKGQRQMLKLSFGVSVMELINLKTTGFNVLFFDEALDGLSEELKIKAFRLFEKLSTAFETVLVVEHSEAFKSLFNDRIDVRLVDGVSQLG